MEILCMDQTKDIQHLLRCCNRRSSEAEKSTYLALDRLMNIPKYIVHLTGEQQPPGAIDYQGPSIEGHLSWHPIFLLHPPDLRHHRGRWHAQQGGQHSDALWR